MTACTAGRGSSWRPSARVTQEEIQATAERLLSLAAWCEGSPGKVLTGTQKYKATLSWINKQPPGICGLLHILVILEEVKSRTIPGGQPYPPTERWSSANMGLAHLQCEPCSDIEGCGGNPRRAVATSMPRRNRPDTMIQRCSVVCDDGTSRNGSYCTRMSSWEKGEGPCSRGCHSDRFIAVKARTAVVRRARAWKHRLVGLPGRGLALLTIPSIGLINENYAGTNHAAIGALFPHHCQRPLRGLRERLVPGIDHALAFRPGQEPHGRERRAERLPPRPP